MKRKYFLGISIIVGGMLIAGFIIFLPPKKENLSLKDLKIPDSISDNQSNFFQYKKENITPPLPLGFNPLDNEKNLTENLAQIYTQELFKRNPNGPQMANGQQQITVPAGQLSQQLFLDKLNQKISFPQFSEKDLKISNDNTLLAQQQYIKDLWVISLKNFNDSLNPGNNIRKAIFDFINQKDSNNLQNYINVLALQIKDVKDLAVPSSWKDFHLKALNLWQKEYSILSSVLNMDNDALKTILASQELANTTQEENDLGTIFIQRLKDLTDKK